MKQILVNNCYDCPYRDANIGGKVPHYCKHPNIVCRAVADEDFELVCPLKELKTGHWIIVETLHGEWEGTKKYACDNCGKRVGVFKSNYCPNCGAKMVEPQESEDNE